MRRLTIAFLALFASWPASARADFSGPGGDGGSQDGVIWAGVQFSPPPGGGGGAGGGASECTWQPAEVYDSGIGSFGDIDRVVNGVRYHLYYRSCPTGDDLVWVAQLTPAELAQRAADAVYDRLPAPQARFAPPAERGVVHVGMWFWTEPSTWQPVSVTAWIATPAGVVWAETTATPTRLVYRPGDGSGVDRCTGPGPVWSDAVGDETPSPCMHTYRHGSATRGGGTYAAELGIEWAISWTSNAAAGGVLAGYTTRSSYDIRVDEIQALATG